MTMTKRVFILAHDTARRNAEAFCHVAPAGWVVTFAEPNRTLEQNALLWPLLADIAAQVVWYGEKLTDENWKDVFSASLRKQKVVPGIDGGFVVCGQRTSKMGKQEFSDLLELIFAFGANHDVVWSEPELRGLQTEKFWMKNEQNN